MKEYQNSSPTFSESILITEPTDPAHADNINAAPKQLLQNDLVLAAALDPDLVDAAFKKAFPSLDPETDPDVMTEEEIEEAIDTTWAGESSEDPDAMSSTEVTQALNTTWSGEASADPDAMTPEEIDEAIAEAQ